MAYLHLEDSLPDHPKLRRLARRLAIREVEAAGHLVLLWTWALRVAPDGDLGSFESEDIAVAARWEGDPDSFLTALLNTKLLDKKGRGYVIHDFSERSGSYRAAWRKRKERERKRESRDQSGAVQDCPVTVQDGPQLSQDLIDRSDLIRSDRSDRSIDQRRRKTVTGQGAVPSDAASEPGAVPDDLWFPIKGHVDTWAPSSKEMRTWVETYPHLDVLAVLREARARVLSVPDDAPRLPHKWILGVLKRAEADRIASTKNGERRPADVVPTVKLELWK